MSYCRWSTDDYQCDVYVYEDCAGGFTTHVASNRPVYKSELPAPVSMDDTAGWFARHHIVSEMLKEADRIDIGLPFDGGHFNDETAKECAARLEQLKAVGYNVPQSAIDALKNENENT